MKKLDPAPPMPEEELGVCPCCGSVWQGCKPWEGLTLTPTELADRMGVTPQNITTRIRKGTIAAFLVSHRGWKNSYLIPIHEVDRVSAEPPPVEDLANQG